MRKSEEKGGFESPHTSSDGHGVPDIQVGRKGLTGLILGLVAAAFAAGYRVANRANRTAEPARSERPIEIRVDPSKVRLADTALELRPLPPPPKQRLDSGDKAVDNSDRGD